MADTVPQLSPRNLTEAIEFCDRLAKTAFVPKDYQNKPGEILAAIQFGAEVGIGPMQALQSIAVINGRPSLWGDALLALVQRSGLLEYIKETATADAATCEVKRKGDAVPGIVTFTQADAIRAGLANKAGPWTQYPGRMRMWRARGFALRNKFPDVLKGLVSREEATDYDLVTTSVRINPDPAQLPPDDYPKGVCLHTFNDPQQISLCTTCGEVVPITAAEVIGEQELSDDRKPPRQAGTAPVAGTPPPATPASPGRALTAAEQEDLMREAKKRGIKLSQISQILFRYFAGADGFEDLTNLEIPKFILACESEAARNG